MNDSDPIDPGEFPIFPVKDGKVDDAQLRAARFLAENYHLQCVQGKTYQLTHRTDLGNRKNYDPKEEEVRSYASRLASPAFRRVRFTPRVPVSSPLLIKGIFNKHFVGQFYRIYMQSHPVWGALTFDESRDLYGFENVKDPPGPLTTVTTLADAITRAYRFWHHERAVDNELKCTPAYYYQHSFLTGQEPAGLVKVLQLFDKPIPHPNPPVDLFMAAHFNQLRVMGCTMNMPLPKLEPPDLAGQDMTKSAGINLYKTGQLELDNIIFRFVIQSCKKDVQLAGNVEFNAVIDQLRRHFKDDAAQISHYTGGIMRKIITAMFPKPELGDPWRDPEKARLIFIVPFFKFAVDKVLFRDVLNKTHGVPPIGIGWSKKRGGMQFLYEHLMQYRIRDNRMGLDIDWFAADGDFKKLDFTLAPNILTFVGFCSMWFYRAKAVGEEDGGDYDLFRYLAEWTTDEFVSKFLHLFPGEARLVIGMMFSGSLLTSWGDTIYVWNIHEMWYLWVYSKLKDSKSRYAEHWKSIWPLPWWFYGDDYLHYLPSYVYPYYVGKEWRDRSPSDKPDAFGRFVKEMGNLELKEEECNIYERINTMVDAFGRIVQRGPKFLQRYFVYEECTSSLMDARDFYYPRAFMPFRVTSDYYTRASMLTTGATVGHYILKLRGLAEDTCAANWEAYQFLRVVHDSILADDYYGPKALAEIAEIESDIRETGRIPDELKKRIKGNLSSLHEALTTFPAWNDLARDYWPTVEGVALANMKARSSGFYVQSHSVYNML